MTEPELHLGLIANPDGRDLQDGVTKILDWAEDIRRFRETGAPMEPDYSYAVQVDDCVNAIIFLTQYVGVLEERLEAVSGLRFHPVVGTDSGPVRQMPSVLDEAERVVKDEFFDHPSKQVPVKTVKEVSGDDW